MRPYNCIIIIDKFVFVGLQNGLLQIFKIKQKVEETSVKLFPYFINNVASNIAMLVPRISGIFPFQFIKKISNDSLF
jgi:hypothetical protein